MEYTQSFEIVIQDVSEAPVLLFLKNGNVDEWAPTSNTSIGSVAGYLVGYDEDKDETMTFDVASNVFGISQDPNASFCGSVDGTGIPGLIPGQR